MDSILQKFYNSGGQNGLNTFSQFGAFQTNGIKYTGLSHSSKSPLPVRPMNTTNNMAILNTNNKPTNLTIKTNFTHIPSQKDFLRPKNLAFNSSSDLLYNNPVQAHRRYNSEYNALQNNVYAETKKNNTKMQMMEEKMKSLELKSQRLEVINDFFFDMFENNLVKEEINKQREKAAELQKQKNKEEGLESSSSSDSESSDNKKKKKKNKKKNNKKLNLNDFDKENFKKKDEFDPQKYQEKTFKHTKDVLENIKKNVGNYIFEEELKKNEQLQIMGEEINELKSKLVNQLEKMQMSQKHQMEKITFCLLNSGKGNMENLALHLFKSNKNSALNTQRGSIAGSRKNSVLNIPKGNAALSSKNSALNSRRGSIHNDTLKSNGTRDVPNRDAILQAVGQDIIPEVNEGEEEGKKYESINKKERKSIKSKYN